MIVDVEVCAEEEDWGEAQGKELRWTESLRCDQGGEGGGGDRGFWRRFNWFGFEGECLFLGGEIDLPPQALMLGMAEVWTSFWTSLSAIVMLRDL